MGRKVRSARARTMKAEGGWWGEREPRRRWRREGGENLDRQELPGGQEIYFTVVWVSEQTLGHIQRVRCFHAGSLLDLARYNGVRNELGHYTCPGGSIKVAGKR
jgi:hypothetical protein